MILKITLTHAIAGSVELPEPDGWKGAQIGLERDPELWTVSPFLKSPFNVYGEFRTWCLMIERVYGPDAIIIAKIRYSPDERGFNFYELFPNSDIEIAVGSFTETVGHELGHGLEYGFVLKSYWAKFQQRFETPVNVQSTEDLDGNAVDVIPAEVVTLSPQVLDMRYESELDISVVLAPGVTATFDPPVTWFIESNFDDRWFQFTFPTTRRELETVYGLPIAFNAERPVYIFFAEYAGKHRIQGRILATLIYYIEGLGSSLNDLGGRTIVNFFYQVNDNDPVEFPVYVGNIEVNGGSPTGSPNYASAFDIDVELEDIKAGDVVRVFGKFIDEAEFASITETSSIGFAIYGKQVTPIDISGMGVSALEYDLGVPDTDIPYSYLNITGQTVFPETESEGYLTHDLLAAAIKRICGAEFYSEALGSPNTVARQYDYTGCFANFMHFKGLQLRQYLLTEKPFFISVKDIWNGINPVHCLAIGVDRVDGVDVVRAWRRTELFDETRVSATFDYVRDISRSYDQEEFFNLINIGYDKWESEDIAGIDDPQSRRNYATILKKLGKKIDILSGMIGASMAFETTRRFTRKKSADYKFDNETFILAVVHNGEYGFAAELSEEFSDVTNLLNEDTRYNKRITSARNLLNWLEYLSGCLQAYQGSTFKFTGGTGNYDMQATMADGECPNDFDGAPLSEKQDIPMSPNYLFWPITYTIKNKISFGQWLQIISDMNAAIRVSQTASGHMAFFTKSLTVTIAESFMTLEAWPKRFFPLQVVNNSDTEHENRSGRTFDDTFDPSFR